MKAILTVIIIGLFVRAEGQGNAGQAVETIVCIRHGEKPADGLGQLTCRGLNRALALPEVLVGKFGKPQFVFAPSTTPKPDGKTDYNYIRPLMTIEPTAIRCGLPVNTDFSYTNINGLETELQKPEYQSATIFVAWEHAKLDEFVRDLVRADGGNPASVPAWPGTDFDTIFLVKITHDGARKSIAFSVDQEGLNNLSDDCPGSGQRGNIGK